MPRWSHGRLDGATLARLRRAMRWLLACLLCAGCEATSVGRAVEAVRNGEDDAGHPSVMLVVGGGRGYCTATLIGRQTALTAGHCVIAAADMELAPSRYSRPEARYRLTDAVVHPLYDPQTAHTDI